MKLRSFILLIIVAVLFTACDNEQDKRAKINPLEKLEQVDKLLSDIAEKPQNLSAPTNKKAIVTGDKGTVIHVDPDKLETVDGSPLGDKIDIELLELTDNSSLMLQNAQTVSNGEILVTGGAYYLNMTSNGKQLKMKSGKGLEVEFPKLTEEEMGLFLGERDSLGQINWIQTENDFVPKDTERPIEPKVLRVYDETSQSDIELLLAYIEEPTGEMTEEEKKEYERKLEKYKRE